MNEANWYHLQNMEDAHWPGDPALHILWLVERLKEEARRMEVMADTVRRLRGALEDAKSILDAENALSVGELLNPGIRGLRAEASGKIKKVLA